MGELWRNWQRNGLLIRGFLVRVQVVQLVGYCQRKGKSVAISVFDRHGKKWDFPNGMSVIDGPVVVDNCVVENLRIQDAAGNQIGGFNNASWSNYTIVDDSASFRAAMKRLAEAARLVNESRDSDSYRAAVTELLKQTFWESDQYVSGWPNADEAKGN